MEESFYRWRSIYIKEGPAGLVGVTRGRKKSLDTDSFKKLSKDQQIQFFEKDNERLRTELAIIKKLSALSIDRSSKPRCLYRVIYELQKEDNTLNAGECCRILSININNYYKFRRLHKIGKAKIHDSQLLADIQFLQSKHKNKLGYRRLKMHLDYAYSSYGLYPVNHKRILRICREHNVICKVRAKNPYKRIARATKEHNYFKNIINREFNIGAPRTKILTDITYLHYGDKTAYLSAAKDSITGEIIAYNIRQDMKLELSLDIINELDANLPKRCIIHSDQGIHYSSPKYSELLTSKGYIQSMSRRGNCLDNAPMESFFGHFKDEVDYKHCNSFDTLKNLVDNYMLYYNEQRKQWNKNKMSPIEYRQHLVCSI